MGLARTVAIKYWKKVPRLDCDEAISVAYQGLLTAAQRFDTDYRPPNDPAYDPFLAFGSFARVRITGAIQDWMRTLDYVPRRHRRLYRDVQELLADQPGRSTEQVASLLGVDPGRVRAVTRSVENPPVSLALLEDDDTDDPPEHVVAADLDTEATFSAQAVQRMVAQTVDDLPDFEKSVVVLRYYLGYDFNRIAVELGSSTSRVKQVHQEAVGVIHGAMLRLVQV